MSNFAYFLPAANLQANGPSLTAGTAASIFVAAAPAAGQTRGTFPAGSLQNGTMFNVRAWGTLTTAATPGTGLWDLRFGSTAIWVPTAFTLPASMSTWGWNIDYEFEVRTVGVTTQATLFGAGTVTVAATAAGTAVQYPVNPFVGATGFDTTVANTLDIFFTESLATATLVCNMSRVLVWNINS